MTFKNIQWFVKNSDGIGFYGSFEPVSKNELVSIEDIREHYTDQKIQFLTVPEVNAHAYGSDGQILICKEGAFFWEEDKEEYIQVKLESIYKDAYNNVIGEHNEVFENKDDEYHNERFASLIDTAVSNSQKEKLTNLFDDLLEKWHSAELALEDTGAFIEDSDTLEKMKSERRKDFIEVLNKFK
ncbi:hypothetical protein NRS6110_04463 [Bacillus subtilis]|uniref:hypothetical protein n=1 Tax=Bacillus TaxID=1386 RepID=UPI00178C9DCF|nr:hypothetical protein [Bacillus subtilis]MBE1867952.1 hypothetical protein [Bacillus subtilis]MDK8209051.1 hypothetical protein [Bacillus subtilis]MDK8209092.1 hypothetical protein [Bacillus subtilis]CAF1787971.1 hypothetical protein NRS6110_04463 [Bacillus subtilis]